MSRPLKNNADWFPHKVAMRDDVRVKAIRRKFGPYGYGIWNCLLEILGESDYFKLDISDLNLKLVAADIDIEIEELKQFIEYCLSIELFQQNEEKTRLWCTVLNDSLQSLIEARQKEREKKKSPKVFPRENEVIPRENEVIPRENEVIPRENGVIPRENEVIPGENGVIPRGNEVIPRGNEVFPRENTHSIVEYRISSPSSTTPTAHDDEILEGRNGDDGPITAKEAVEKLKGDQEWLQQMQRRHGISAANIVRWLSSFVVECDCRGKQAHENLADVQQHFNDWLQKQKKLAPSSKGGKATAKTEAPTQRWDSCYKALCKAVTPDELRDTFSHLGFESYNKESQVILLTVPTKELYETIEGKYVNMIMPFLAKYFGPVKLNYRIKNS